MIPGVFSLLVVVLSFLAIGLPYGPPDATGALEGTSLLGRELYALPDDDGSIAAAQKALAADPHNVGLILKLSKAQAGKRQYREAVATCSAGLAIFPDNADLYVERGHRELGLRQFPAGKTDLSHAVKLAPQNLDAQYHLGMARYFLREFTPAAEAFGQSMDLAKNDDSLIDGANWTYVSLRRSGQNEAAARVLTRITPQVTNKEPHLLFYLRLLHFYQGILSERELMPPKPANPGDVEAELSYNTINYGVGNWYLYNQGNASHAREFFARVVKGSAWNSWGFIGSEIELAAARSHSR